MYLKNIASKLLLCLIIGTTLHTSAAPHWSHAAMKDLKAVTYKLSPLGAVAANGLLALSAFSIHRYRIRENLYPKVYINAGLAGIAASAPFAFRYKVHPAYRVASLILPTLCTGYGVWQKLRWKYYEYIKIHRDIKTINSPDDLRKYYESFGGEHWFLPNSNPKNRKKTLMFVLRGALGNNRHDVVYWTLHLLRSEDLFYSPEENYMRKSFNIITEFLDKKTLDKKDKTTILNTLPTNNPSPLTEGGKCLFRMYKQAQSENTKDSLKLCKSIEYYLKN